LTVTNGRHLNLVDCYERSSSQSGCILVSNTYFVVLFLFCFSSSCVPHVASFSGLFLFCFSSSCVPYVASFSGLFLFCFSSSCVSNVASFSGLSIFYYAFGYYLTFISIRTITSHISYSCHKSYFCCPFLHLRDKVINYT
jgi:hypothetical protein